MVWLGDGLWENLAPDAALPTTWTSFSQLYRLDAGESPVRLQQRLLSPSEQLPDQLDFVAFGPVRDPLVTFSLDTRELATDVRGEIHRLLTPSNTTLKSDFEVLGRLRKLTQEVFNESWSISRGAFSTAPFSQEHAAPITDQLIAPQPAQQMHLLVPSIDEYLHNPFRLGREYWTEMALEGTIVRLDAVIRPESGTVDFTISKPSERLFGKLEILQVTGSLARGDPLRETVKDLRTVVWKAMETFWDRGLIGLREFVTIANVRKTPLTRLESDAVIKLRLGTETSSITLASGAYTRESVKNRETTWCRWRFASGSPEQDLHVDIARIADVFQIGLNRTELEEAFRRLQAHENFQQFEAHPAAITSVFGPTLAASLQAIPELTLAPQAPRTTEQLAAVLRGFNRAVISLPAKTVKDAPQLFNTMEVAIAPSGAVMLAFQNAINNRVEAEISPHSQFDPNSGDDLVKTLANLLAAQVASPTPSQERCNILRTLHVARDRDPQNNVVKEVGVGLLPHFLDTTSHALIDQDVSLLLKLFQRLRRTEHGASHIVSQRPGCIRLELGEQLYQFNLTIEFSDGYVTGVTVTPKTRAQSVHSNSPKPATYTYACNIPIGGTDSGGSTTQKLVKLATWFFDLSRPREQHVEFEGSRLQEYLDEIAQPLWRGDNRH
jgi:hypothetical protein